ncbi:ATP-binding protein [Gulosibacter molinativorax]|uniref:GNAT family N-acetyltransferase n=1 Tax=Gulosibacter molinativorax TaxID=256821 RepID=A0ABT7C674_9MICO|nr:GNAT family N-acetyltransferase [Gulosibacter molinativorax]MDJ1370603.1 GNAT family N-acetyltransferase [Gulosibacter molinativorax]
MTNWRIRDLQPTDVDGFLKLWEEYRASGNELVYSLSEVLASIRVDTAVAAVVGEEVVGVTVARAAHDQGWIVFNGVSKPWQRRGISRAMLGAVEQRLATQGIQRVSILVPDGEEHVQSLTRSGFADKAHLRYFERTIPVSQQELALLRDLGGRMLARDRWDNIGGMQEEKNILERRLVLPLSDPELAQGFGVVPPRAIVLFGPPGTGKTTFAKGIASRLEWPFVEVFPSRLAASPKGLAGELRETFEKIEHLDHAVVFIDEVEEIAVRRGGEPPSPMQGVTNELLKLIPAFREKPGRLLICATNFIRALDPAFLRHGRFDYVIPIGLPDAAARHAIWVGFVPEKAAEGLNFDALVQASEGFSPADIEFAARSAAQTALERAVTTGDKSSGPTLDDYLNATAQTRTTVSSEVNAEFQEDIEEIARL